MKPFQSDGTFHPIATGKGLRRSAVRGVGAVISGSAGQFVVGIGTVVVLARLLTPSDFGIVTMVTTFSLLLRSFGLNGFTELIMQREEITDSLASNLFWINLGVGTILTLVFAGSGPALAHLFHNSAVVQVTKGMSLTIVIGCSGYVHTGLLQRAMHFRTTATINLAGQVLQFIVSVVLAMAGWHCWALVWGSVAQTATLAVGAWLACRWIPSLPRRDPGTGAGLKFAMNVYSHFAFWYLTRNTDNFLVGWRFGAQALGFYKKAYDLFVLPQMQLLAPMNAVAVSTLSRVSRDREQFQRYFLRAISVLALDWNGNRSGFCFGGIGYHSISFGAWLGAGWPNLRLIWSWNRSHVGVLPLRVDSSFDWASRKMVPLGIHRICVYRKSVLAGFTLGAVRNRFGLDRFVFSANLSSFPVRGKADRVRFRAGIRRHLEILCSIGWGCFWDRSNHQGAAVFCDGVWGAWRSRADGFSFFGIFRAISRWRDYAPPGTWTPQFDR